MSVDNINIHDGARILSRNPGGDRDYTYPHFDASNANLGWRPTLFFRVQKGSGGAGTITLRVSLNGSVVYTESFGSEVLRSLHEIVDNNILQAEDNELVIEATAGTGTIEVSAMLMLYRTV